MLELPGCKEIDAPELEVLAVTLEPAEDDAGVSEVFAAFVEPESPVAPGEGTTVKGAENSFGWVKSSWFCPT